MAQIYCTNCHQAYPSEGVPYLCPACGGVYDWDKLPAYQPPTGEPGLPGIWHYRSLLGLPDEAPVITLGEGNTPLIWDQVDGLALAYKMESLNPTGSYKDRGSAVLLSQLLLRGVRAAVEDSSGNAGASFAAYSARSGIKARVFVPVSASGPKRKQIEMFGAELVPIPGPRSAAADAVIKEAQAGAVYASHAFLPFGMAGVATIAYELLDQIGAVPDTVVAPVGHGSLLLGIIRGFVALKAVGAIKKLPRFIGVQSGACAPVWAAYHQSSVMLAEGVTVAEGVRVLHPVRKKALLDALDRQVDRIIAIEEELILPARDQLALRGIYVEPTSAIVWAALKQITDVITAPAVLIMSGSGYKFQK
jgi:threonine synthase